MPQVYAAIYHNNNYISIQKNLVNSFWGYYLQAVHPQSEIGRFDENSYILESKVANITKLHYSIINQANQWSLPGGRLEGGESPRDGAIRELMEETGEKIVIGVGYAQGNILAGYYDNWDALHIVKRANLPGGQRAAFFAVEIQADTNLQLTNLRDAINTNTAFFAACRLFPHNADIKDWESFNATLRDRTHDLGNNHGENPLGTWIDIVNQDMTDTLNRFGINTEHNQAALNNLAHCINLQHADGNNRFSVDWYRALASFWKDNGFHS